MNGGEGGNQEPTGTGSVRTSIRRHRNHLSNKKNERERESVEVLGPSPPAADNGGEGEMQMAARA